MKTAALALLAAASVEHVAATYSLGSSWTQAKPYSCPGNTNNNCNAQQQSGWDFSDVPTGSIANYGGFDFSGWSCENDFGKRDSLLSARTFGSTGRSIVGDCTADKNTTPCISAGAGTGHFSVDTFSISTEFDTRLEFHYEMPDGSTCKQSAQCSSQGTTVKNSQCGGAKKVSVVYPGNGKSSCKTKVHHVSWDCGSNAPPPSHSQPAHTQPAHTPPSGGPHYPSHSQPGYSVPPYSQPGQTTTAPAGAETTTAPGETAPGETSPATTPYGNPPPAGETTTAPAGAQTTTAPGETAPGETAPAESTTAPAGETTTAPAGAETTTAPGETAPGETSLAITSYGNTLPAGATTAAAETTASTEVAVSTSVITAPSDTSAAGAETTTAPDGTTTAVVETTAAGTTAAVTEATTAPAVTSEAGAVTTGSESVYTTVYQSTSTVFTTTVHTITSCAPEVTNCPARTDKPVLTTVTVAVNTTICPVTATITGGPGPQQTSEAAAATQAPSTQAPSGTGSGSSPVESGLPCPDVLPKCINTWLPLVPNCKDNTDASCYCPSKDLVQKVFNCIYSNGKNDDDVSAAIVFFQGVCASYAGSNPAVATGAATITSIITVTGTPVAAPTDYTTVVVATTITEPCVSEGTTIPGSSTTVYVSTALTVPQVSITAAPVTTQPTYVPPGQTAPVESAPVETAPGAGPTLITSPVATPPAATGTGTGISLPPASTGIPVVGGAGRLGAGMSLGLAIMAAVVAL
ncbi:hypothetical protein V8C37DRAFT_176552 [Trichoderma ceciliae]